MDTYAEFRSLLRARFPMVADHPDVAGVLRDPELLGDLGRALATPFMNAGITKVCAPEARGPILGALTAAALGAGLIIARKDGANHPGADLRGTSAPTWRNTPQSFLVRSFDIAASDRILLVDDWITTGNSLRTVRSLVEAAGGRYLGASVLVDKTDDETREALGVRSLTSFDELMARDRE